MKILLISNMYPSIDEPGYGVFVKNLENSARPHGLEFDLAVIRGRRTSPILKLASYVNLFIRIYYLLLTRKFDAIYVHYLAHSLLPLVPISPFIKNKLLLNAHGEDLLPRSRLERLIFAINKKTIERSRLIIVPSDYFQDIAKSKLSSPNIFVSPSGGIDLSIFHPTTRTNHPSNEITIGYVSRFDDGKGWDTLLDAVHELKHRRPGLLLKVLAAGSGPQTPDFLEKVRKLGIAEFVDHIGPVHQKDLPEIYRKLDLFIFPTKLPESLGLVGIEAMACGTPPICSDIGGIKTYMSNGINGFTFPAGNHIELANRIAEYAGICSADKERIINAALSTASEYDSREVSKKLTSKIKEVLVHGN